MSTLEVIGLVIMLAVCGFTWFRGGSTERRAALAVSFAWIASTVADMDWWTGVQWGILVIDAALAAFLVWLSTQSRRIWPAVAAAGVVLIVLTHIAFLTSASMRQAGFFTVYYLWSYLVLGAVLWGGVTAARRRKA
ncbi:MAG: hypothetical protein K2X07_09620 [Caulobacteraceae bacterium]|nr:hypothetical protein [Caulobacteraceae bacterium]